MFFFCVGEDELRHFFCFFLCRLRGFCNQAKVVWVSCGRVML